MALSIASRRLSAATLQKRFGDALRIDVTSRGAEPWVRLSPFYPHGGIPVPFTPGRTAISVEGVWQALKVFERANVDASKLDVASMKGIKRTVRSLGRVLGHRKGLHGDELLGYVEARRAIYVPTYEWMLAHRATAQVEQVRELARARDVVLLDYDTNGDVDDTRTPLSHAALLARFIAETDKGRIAAAPIR
jgi:hypothetical protein